MYRALIKIFVAMALAAGLSLTAAGSATATPVARVAERAVDCTPQQNAYGAAQNDFGQKTAAAAQAKKAVTKAKKAVKKAKSKSKAVKKKAAKKLKKARKAFKTATSNRDAAGSAVNARQAELDQCRASDNGGGTNPQTGPTASPIQALCDNGLPQELCDALGGLAGGSSALSLATLCNSVPEAAPLCTLLTSGSSIDTNSLVSVLDTLVDALNLKPMVITALGPLGTIFGLLGFDSVLSNTQLTSLLSTLGLTALVP